MVGAQALPLARLPLASQLLFSSTSAVWSQTGAGHYAAANALLDALASAHQAAGLPATALQLGPFAEAGMAAGHVAELAALGLRGMPPSALSAAAAAAGVAPQLLWARLEAQRFVGIYSAKGRWSLLDAMRSVPIGAISVDAAPATALHDLRSPAATQQPRQLVATPNKSGMSLAAVTEAVKRAATDILGAELEFDGNFPAGGWLLCTGRCHAMPKHDSHLLIPLQYNVTGGFDSLSAVELSASLSSSLNLQLPGTLVFDYPSVAAMAAHIHSLLMPYDESPGRNTDAVALAVAPGHVALAASSLHNTALISIDIAARLPVGYSTAGEANSDGISVAPFGRWDLEGLRVSLGMPPPPPTYPTEPAYLTRELYTMSCAAV